jgi:hypothetical protein
MRKGGVCVMVIPPAAACRSRDGVAQAPIVRHPDGPTCKRVHLVGVGEELIVGHAG